MNPFNPHPAPPCCGYFSTRNPRQSGAIRDFLHAGLAIPYHEANPASDNSGFLAARAAFLGQKRRRRTEKLGVDVRRRVTGVSRRPWLQIEDIAAQARSMKSRSLLAIYFPRLGNRDQM